MADIGPVKELNNYMKMYNLLMETINECVDICTDDVVKNKLAEVKKKADYIYNAEVSQLCQKLSPDELTVILLLGVIKEIEVNAESCDFNIEIFKEVSQWVTRYQDTTGNDRLLSWWK